MSTTTIALIFALLQGPAGPADRSAAPIANRGQVPQPPPIFIPAPPTTAVCPLNFCGDFVEVCESSGSTEFGCGLADAVCEEAPCDACDKAVASCNEAEGAHCDEIATKCRSQLVGCCELTVAPNCSSTETIGAFLPTYCDEHPLGRPAQCTSGLASSAKCVKAINAMDGNDITTCDYIDCVAALKDAPCDLMPDACLPFAEFVE